MPSTVRKHSEFMQDIVRKYRDDLQLWPATAKQIAAWAVRRGEWNPTRGTAVTLCARELARAMREETYRDPQGRIFSESNMRPGLLGGMSNLRCGMTFGRLI